MARGHGDAFLQGVGVEKLAFPDHVPIKAACEIFASCQERARPKDIGMSEWAGYTLPKRMLPSKLGCLKAGGNSRQVKERLLLAARFQGCREVGDTSSLKNWSSRNLWLGRGILWGSWRRRENLILKLCWLHTAQGLWGLLPLSPLLNRILQTYIERLNLI